uniref:Uncharacterized protein n=1 Tax=Mesocestoides corti TaxID=53468 RepID=A0A5K3FZK8_MESCO
MQLNENPDDSSVHSTSSTQPPPTDHKHQHVSEGVGENRQITAPALHQAPQDVNSAACGPNMLPPPSSQAISGQTSGQTPVLIHPKSQPPMQSSSRTNLDPTAQRQRCSKFGEFVWAFRICIF